MRTSCPRWLSKCTWVAHQEGDAWTREARKKGYACRSAFKLTQIDDKFKVFSNERTHCVLDIGSNPGSWLQVAGSRSHRKSMLIGVDRKISPSVRSLDLGIRVAHNGQTHRLYKTSNEHAVHLIDGDISDRNTQEKIKSLIRGSPKRPNVILSDVSPDRSGDNIRDYTDAARLNSDILYVVTSDGLLEHGGHFICKVLGGSGYTNELIDFCRRNFERTRIYKPESSRRTSSEQYLVAQFYSRNSGIYGGRTNTQSASDGLERFGIDSWPGLVSAQRKRF